MSYELDIKAKSLSAEAKIIRRHERRLIRNRYRLAASVRHRTSLGETIDPETPKWLDEFDAARARLYHHRVDEVRPEQRATHLARMFVKGRAYATVEVLAYDCPDFGRVFEIVEKFDETVGSAQKQVLAQRFEQWKQEAEAWWTAAVTERLKVLEETVLPARVARKLAHIKAHEDRKAEDAKLKPPFPKPDAA